MTPAKLSVTPRNILGLQQAQSLLLFKQTVDDLYLPVFQYIPAVDFIQQHVQIGFGSAQYLILKFQQQSSKAKSALLTFARWRHCVIKLMRLLLTDVFRTKRR